MPSGLCYECGPKGSKLKSPKDIKQVKLHIDEHTKQIIYLCQRCARELGYGSFSFCTDPARAGDAP